VPEAVRFVGIDDLDRVRFDAGVLQPGRQFGDARGQGGGRAGDS
jgi:hypothetical protein